MDDAGNLNGHTRLGANATSMNVFTSGLEANCYREFCPERYISLHGNIP